MNSSNGLYNIVNNAPVTKATSKSSMQSNLPASIPSLVPSTSNSSIMPATQQAPQLNSPTTSSNLPFMQPPVSRPQEAEPNDSQSSVQRILQEMMMSSQMNDVGPLGDIKRAKTTTPGLNGVNSSAGNPLGNSFGIGGMGFGAMGGGLGSSTASGLRTAMGNNAMPMTRRIEMNHGGHDLTQLSHLQQQHDIGNQLLGGLGAANSFNNLQYDWKTSQ
ncbi:hypothetical protein GUJ93_ZPchr0009g1181 [Zizania palustris]|uniref:Uncharacterized protein n=1 Tax=Zizania palustris TaxID=103762 RepID=A0A8J5RCB0_ZIZPA|nr:hypothetical protein GUJ93_ZPchr0009g1181 [Zizania palustris]